MLDVVELGLELGLEGLLAVDLLAENTVDQPLDFLVWWEV